MKTSELIRLLKKNDCFFVEHGKEHDKWHSNRTGKDVRIPRHGGKEIPTGTANRILKDADIRLVRITCGIGGLNNGKICISGNFYT